MKLRLFLVGLLFALLLFNVQALDLRFLSSSLPDTVFTWETNETVGLPWYPVSPAEVEICSRGLTTMLTETPSTTISSFQLDHPIYRDTITILAQLTQEEGLTYYEVGWYFQPFDGSFAARVIVYDNLANEHILKSEDAASKADSFSGYVAFPVPCDLDVYRTCLPITGRPTQAMLEWWPVVNGTEGVHQYLVAPFIETNRSVTP